MASPSGYSHSLKPCLCFSLCPQFLFVSWPFVSVSPVDLPWHRGLAQVTEVSAQGFPSFPDGFGQWLVLTPQKLSSSETLTKPSPSQVSDKGLTVCTMLLYT